MAVDLISYRKMEDQVAIHEAAAQGIKSMESFIQIISQQPSAKKTDADGMECSDLTDLTVSRFKKVISLLNRTGHARFRRGPVSSSVTPQKPSGYTNSSPPILPPVPPVMAVPLSVQAPQSVTLDFTKNNIFPSNSKAMDFEYSKDSFSVSASTSSFISSGVTGDASVNGNNRASMYLPPPSATAVKPSLQSGEYQKKRCHEHDNQKPPTSKCHCSKKRKNKDKRTIRVPAISSKIADIPPDEYSWRKYGQKPIKGSPYPRGYYKCSTMRGCPAKKHVERDTEDPAMLIVTYSGEHRHNASLLLESAPVVVSAMPLE